MHAVCAVYGGFTNHVRWLMTLSKEYNDDNKLNRHGYIVQANTYPKDAYEKSQFILKHIYNETRTCYNWLKYETIHVTNIWQTIRACHYMTYHNKADFADVDKTFLLRCSNKFANDKWLKFRPWTVLELKNYNNLPPHIDTLFGDKDRKNMLYKHKNPNHKLLTARSETLYTEILDKEFYENMVNFFEISNEYEVAQIIHTAWYDLHIKAKNEFLDWLYNAEYPTFKWSGHWLQTALKYPKDRITLEEFEFMKSYLKPLYEGNNE